MLDHCQGGYFKYAIQQLVLYPGFNKYFFLEAEQQANKCNLWMAQLGDTERPRRPGFELEIIFTAWGNDSEILQ